MGAWKQQCGQLDQYGMQYSRLFANLCNAGVSTETLSGTLAATCAASSSALEPIVNVS